MALIALIRRKNKDEIPSLIERIKIGDEFCFVVNQKKLDWHIARFDGRANALDYRGEIESAGGIVPPIIKEKTTGKECEHV